MKGESFNRVSTVEVGSRVRASISGRGNEIIHYNILWQLYCKVLYFSTIVREVLPGQVLAATAIVPSDLRRDRAAQQEFSRTLETGLDQTATGRGLP